MIMLHHMRESLIRYFHIFASVVWILSVIVLAHLATLCSCSLRSMLSFMERWVSDLEGSYSPVRGAAKGFRKYIHAGVLNKRAIEALAVESPRTTMPFFRARSVVCKQNS